MFNMVDFFSVISQSTEILIESNFWLELYVSYIFHHQLFHGTLDSENIVLLLLLLYLKIKLKKLYS